MLVVSELPYMKDLVKVVNKIPEFAMLGESSCFQSIRCHHYHSYSLSM